MAKAQNLVDNRVMGLLTPESPEQKGYVDPQTGKFFLTCHFAKES